MSRYLVIIEETPTGFSAAIDRGVRRGRGLT